MTLHLIDPSPSHHRSFLDSLREWDGAHQDGTGLRSDDDPESVEGFARWVDDLKRSESRVDQPGYVTCTYQWIVRDGVYLGAIALRHELTDALLRTGGHIGYSVRPSARRRGVATWALEQMVRRAGDRGMPRVLVTCAVHNSGSQRTIESNGGVLEDIRQDPEGTEHLRYWIATS